MSEVAFGVTDVFDDVTAVTLGCRFANGTHADEPGCAIHAAVAKEIMIPLAANGGVSYSRRVRSTAPPRPSAAHGQEKP